MTQYPTSVVQSVQRPPIKTSNVPYLEVTRTFPMWPRRVIVQWVLRNPGSAMGFNFNVYRAGAPEGPWELLTETALEDIFFYVDDAFEADFLAGTPDLLAMSRSVYYKVTAQLATTPPAPDAPIYSVTKDADPWLDQRRLGIQRKLVRDAMISLKRVVGTEVALLKRRYWGTKCPNCLTATGMSARANCSTCYGTSFTGGYWDPVYSYAQLFSNPVTATLAIQGEKETRKTQALTANVPMLEKNDIVVFLRSNKRFIIEQKNATQIHNVEVHQELVVSELAPGSIEYAIAVDPWREPCWWV